MENKCLLCDQEHNNDIGICDECSSIDLSMVLFGYSLVMLEEIKKLKIKQFLLFILVIILGVLVLWN